MFCKWGIFVLLLCAWITQAKAENINIYNGSPKLIVDGFNFVLSYDKNDNQLYINLNSFIVNYSNDTLKYWNSRERVKEFFEVTGSKGFQVVNQSDASPLYEQVVIPPHRSQRIDLRLLMENKLQGLFNLNITMNFYKWFNTKDFESDKKYHNAITLSDKMTLEFFSYGDNSYRANSIGDEKKYLQILPPTDFHLLTAAERELLSVTIDENRNNNRADTIYVGKNAIAFDVPVTIHNDGNDTLKYLSYTCSWEEYYHIDNKLLKIGGFVCDYNVPCEVVVPPHGSHSEILPAVYHSEGKKQPIRFRVGVNINKEALRLTDLLETTYEYHLMNNNIVWSNTVQIKVTNLIDFSDLSKQSP